jgi:hypothetical protein
MPSLGSLLLLGATATVLAQGCSLGQGTGSVCGWLDVPGCWSGAFDLHPDFFAAVPTNSAALQIRIQNGIDYETFSDGVAILVDDAGQIRGDPLPDGTPRTGLLGQPLLVTLPAGVTPPGVPIKAVANPSMAHATLYVEQTCRIQNVALYATTCTLPTIGEPAMCGDAGPGSIASDAGAIDGGTPQGNLPGNMATSTITFHNLFDGKSNESNAQQRLTDAEFDFYLADPREGSAGGLGPPPPCRGHLRGQFHFYFQRGRPAQPFP